MREFYERAEPELEHPLLRFDTSQIATIGAAFGEAIREHAYTCYACAVMPDHVHILIRKHRDQAEAMIDNLQHKSAMALFDSGTVDVNHPVWTERGWKGFLNTPSRVRTVIRYIERNPPKEGLSEQEWPFVVEYDNWPYHRN